MLLLHHIEITAVNNLKVIFLFNIVFLKMHFVEFLKTIYNLISILCGAAHSSLHSLI